MALHFGSSDDAPLYDTTTPVASSDPIHGWCQTVFYQCTDGQQFVFRTTHRDYLLLRLCRDLNIILGQRALTEPVDMAGFWAVERKEARGA